MESFFKNRTVLAKGHNRDHSAAGHAATCALPPLQGHTEHTAEEEKDVSHTTEYILDAEAEGYKVEMIKERDIVTQIRITCACGKQFTLNCHYPPPENERSD